MTSSSRPRVTIPKNSSSGLLLLTLLLSAIFFLLEIPITAHAFSPNNNKILHQRTIVLSTATTASQRLQAAKTNGAAADSFRETIVSATLAAAAAATSSTTTTTTASCDSNASPLVRPTSSLPTRRRKKKTNKKKSRKKDQTRNAATSLSSSGLSEQEVQSHVQEVYMHGPGSLMRNKEISRQRRQQQQQQGQSSVAQLGVVAQQADLYKKLDGHPALVLNADYQPMSYLPLSMWHWQEAVKAVFSGKVTVVDVYPDVMIRAANLEIPLPAVIALNEYVPAFHQTPAFTKRNVFLRDEYRCQYCLQHFHTRDLSLDHVVPRCNGGQLHWENAVTCCCKCNGRKGSLAVRDLKRVGMKLAKDPVTPTQYQLASIAGRMVPRKVHGSWKPYLGASVSKDVANQAGWDLQP